MLYARELFTKAGYLREEQGSENDLEAFNKHHAEIVPTCPITWSAIREKLAIQAAKKELCLRQKTLNLNQSTSMKQEI